MSQSNARLPFADKLSPELRKLKCYLEDMLELNLNKIDGNKAWTWPQKQKASAVLQQAYESYWLSQLSEAGIIPTPTFEAAEEKATSEKTLCEEFKVYENLWK
jgi:hypothetical protein